MLAMAAVHGVQLSVRAAVGLAGFDEQKDRRSLQPQQAAVLTELGLRLLRRMLAATGDVASPWRDIP